MKLALLLIYSYLVGSIPFGLVLARMKGVDLRSVGSGNIGATNVLRSVGKQAAVLTLLGDLLKGTAAVATGRMLGAGPAEQGLLGLAAILGHDFSIFLKFRGGKGVATSLGVLLIYLPAAGILTVIMWLASAGISRYSSVGAIVAFGLLPVTALLTGANNMQTAVCIMISALLIVKHRDNIKRLIKGTEGKIGEPKT